MHQQRWDLARVRMGNHLYKRRTRYRCASDPVLLSTMLTIPVFLSKFEPSSYKIIKFIALCCNYFPSLSAPLMRKWVLEYGVFLCLCDDLCLPDELLLAQNVTLFLQALLVKLVDSRLLQPTRDLRWIVKWKVRDDSCGLYCTMC